MKDRESIWKKRKECLEDPEKPRAYLVSFAGWMHKNK